MNKTNKNTHIAVIKKSELSFPKTKV